MAADRTLRIVVLPEADAAGPLLDLLRTLVAQSLVGVPLVFARGDMSALELGPRAEDDRTGELREWVETANCERFLLVNLITADAIASGGDPGLAEADPSTIPELAAATTIDAFLRAALAAKVGQEGERNQLLEVLNVVVPAAAHASVPRHLHSFGPHVAANPDGWRNVMVAPEVQETSRQAVVPVTPDEGYVAHVAASLLTMLGGWAGATWDPEVPAYRQDEWTVLRSRSRALIAPELPVRILGRVGRTGSRIPISDKVDFEIFPEPDQAVRLAKDELIARHKLTREAFADVGYRPPQRKVSLREFFRILWAWLTHRLPEIVKGIVDERVRDIRNKADAVVNAALSLDADSDIKVQLFGTDEDEEPLDPDAADTPEKKERIWQFLRPEPALWNEVRSISFGFVDGGDVPPPRLQRMLGEGNQRYVLGDRTWVVPPPGIPMWEPPRFLEVLPTAPGPTNRVVDVDWANAWERVFEELIPDEEVEDPSERELDIVKAKVLFDAARERARRSLLWVLGEHLTQQREEIDAHLAKLREELADALDPEGEHEQKIAEEGRRSKRRALLRFILSVIVLAGLAAGGWWAIGALALTGLVLAVAWTVVVVVVLVGFIRSLWRCVYGWFLADHKMFWLRKGRVQVLEEAIAFDQLQQRRFRYLCAAFKDWADIISTLCFNPFRQPQPPKVRRVRHPELGLPVSHQVAEGYTTAPRLDGVVSAVASQLITPGWLSITFESARTYAVEEHKIRTRGGAFEPDLDRATTDEIGPRRALKDAILTGRARRRRELEVLRTIHHSIRSGSGYLDDPAATPRPVVDRLFTPLAKDRDPSTFLRESTVGEPSNFNRDFIPFDRVPERVASDDGPLQATIPDEEIELPDLPTTEELIEGTSVEFPALVFSSWAVEVVGAIPATEVPIFSTDASAAVIDLDRARTLWLPPPDEDLGEVVTTGEIRDGWTVDPSELPAIGHLIAPDPYAPKVDGRGPYRFLIEEDGEPLSHPRNAPLEFRLRTDCSPPAGVSLALRALQCVANRTGHSFTFAGTFEGLPPGHPDHIEIAWAFDEEFQRWQAVHQPDYQGTAVGWGGPSIVQRASATGRRTLSGGLVLLNADMKADPGFVGGFSHGMVLLHELGHVMNLHHVIDPREIMCAGNGEIPSPLDYGPGDCTGFREVALAGESA
ncbi:MAG: hypothetical protein U0P45_07870 [Acidimicrobiales bacterium]